MFDITLEIFRPQCQVTINIQNDPNPHLSKSGQAKQLI